MTSSLRTLLIVLAVIAYIAAEVYDPLNVFCGSTSCYDVLHIQRSATGKEVKKAFRQLSLSLHPDKNKEENATEMFRVINKAFQVLSGNESRPLFDYYLDHPRDYFKVSGEHYIRNVPYSDVRIVLTLVVLLISWFFHVIQNQRYEKFSKFLRNATFNNLGVRNGGSKQTLELYRRATELYEIEIKAQRAKGDKAASKVKMIKDPMFKEIVDQVVDSVKIEGGFRKPHWKDSFAMQVVAFPYTLMLWAQTYHRRYVSTTPLPMDEQIEMAREKVGKGAWEELNADEKINLVKSKIWLRENYNLWIAEKEAEAKKQGEKKKKMRRGRQSSEEETDAASD
jgi:DnaJ family protein C protein 25